MRFIHFLLNRQALLLLKQKESLFVKQARTVAKGQVATPIAIADKWVVIKLEDERLAEILPFEKSKDSLAQNLARKAIEDFVSQSLEKAKINVLLK